jgi:hypothetical protein
MPARGALAHRAPRGRDERTKHDETKEGPTMTTTPKTTWRRHAPDGPEWEPPTTGSGQMHRSPTTVAVQAALLDRAVNLYYAHRPKAAEPAETVVPLP